MLLKEMLQMTNINNRNISSTLAVEFLAVQKQVVKSFDTVLSFNKFFLLISPNYAEWLFLYSIGYPLIY